MRVEELLSGIIQRIIARESERILLLIGRGRGLLLGTVRGLCEDL